MAVYVKIDVHGLENLHPTLWKLHGYIQSQYEKKGKDVHITSIGEGIHRNGSFHYIGRAIDFRREGFTKRDIRSMINDWCQRYGYNPNDFDLLEYQIKGIFHLEFDPK